MDYTYILYDKVAHLGKKCPLDDNICIELMNSSDRIYQDKNDVDNIEIIDIDEMVDMDNNQIDMSSLERKRLFTGIIYLEKELK